MRESLALLETIINYPWFIESSTILFFNKIDLFDDKIKTSDIAKYFPSFQGAASTPPTTYFILLSQCCISLLSLSHVGPAQDAEAGKTFIASLFLSVNPDPDNKRIFHHFTCGTDTENIRRVFEDVKTHVLEENLRDYNLM